jgi:hypothetical protein
MRSTIAYQRFDALSRQIKWELRDTPRVGHVIARRKVIRTVANELEHLIVCGLLPQSAHRTKECRSPERLLDTRKPPVRALQPARIASTQALRQLINLLAIAFACSLAARYFLRFCSWS